MKRRIKCYLQSAKRLKICYKTYFSMIFFGDKMKILYLCRRFLSEIALNINARKDNPE